MEHEHVSDDTAEEYADDFEEMVDDEAEIAEAEARNHQVKTGKESQEILVRRPGRPRRPRLVAQNDAVASSSSASEPGFDNIDIDYNEIEMGEQICGGGNAILYKARWRRTLVAVKRIFDPVITEELRRGFTKEVSIMAWLRHPNVVQFMGACKRPPNLCIVTEFMARGSLYHVLHKSNVEIDRTRAKNIAIGICCGLNFIHSQGLVHRDIKSQNVLADEYLRVKICDFGLCCRFSDLSCPQQHQAGGTPCYAAPELFVGEQASFASDVFALGVVLWEIWHKEVPFEGLDPNTIVQKAAKAERPEISKSVPFEWKQLIRSCWSQNKHDRPTAEAVLNILEQMEQ